MLLIFNIDEQLQAVLKNDGKSCPYYDAYHTEELNENFQNVFTFTVPSDHADAQYVTEGNLVAFRDLDLDWQLFEIKRIVDLHGDGLTRTAYCEHAAYELIDDFIEDVRPTDCSATFALTQALSGTRWSVGTVDDLGLNSTNYYYQSALGAIQKVATVWGGELRFRVVVTGGIISARYVDLLIRRGADTGKQFEYGRHTLEIEREVDLTTVMTAAYGRGKGVEVGDGYGRRLDFADIVWTTPTNPVDKPLSQEWVGDPTALAQWGRAGGTRHRFGTFEDSEETDPAVLLQKTWDYLQANKTPRATYRMTAMDLERQTGYSHEKVRLGDTTRGIDRLIKPALLVSVRIIGLTRNVLQPEDTKLVFGNFAPSLADAALSQQQINQTTRDRQGVWDRATQFNQDGTLNTTWLTGIIDVLTNQLSSTTSNWYTDENGNLVFETLDGTAAMMLTGNGFMLSDEKDPVTDEWVWRTFGTGAGFTADELNAGQIRTSLIQILGNTNFYWDGDHIYMVNPNNLNEQVRLSREGIKFTRDGGQTEGVAIGYDGIRMEGKPSDPRVWYSPTGPKIYNQNGELVGHLGYYETLAAQLATFVRPSPAYDSYGNLIASGVPRYEYMRQPAPVWQDTFDTDQLSQYTSGGDTPATWAVSGGVLTGAGGTNATLIKNDLLLRDCEIEITSDQSARGYAIARYQDNNNYYLLYAIDNTENGETGRIGITKRVNGNFVNVGNASINFPRGTAKKFKYSLFGSTLEAWFDGVKMISVTDTTFAGGAVGLRQHAPTPGTSTRFIYFSIYQVQRGVMVEEGCINIVATWPTGWIVGGDAGMAAVDQGVLPGATLNTVRLTNSGTTPGSYTNYSTPFALSPSTKYALRIKARGTVGAGKFYVYVLSGTGTLVQANIIPSLTGAFQEFFITFITTADITGTSQYIRFDHNGNDAGYIEIAEVEIIQKAYPLSFPGYGTTRAAEVLTIPSSVFTKGNWTVKLKFTPTSKQDVNYNVLWEINTSTGEWGQICTTDTGFIALRYNGANIISSIKAEVGQTYFIAASGDNSVLRLCINGNQAGSDTGYTEFASSLLATVQVGSSASGEIQANGLISDFAVLNKAETLAEHQTAYNSGLPLTVTDTTTYLMSCDGTLQPTVRGFGLWSKNGRFILQDPAAGQGIEVWDGATRNIIFGRLDDGRIGGELSKCDLFANNIYSGVKGSNSYVGLTSDNSLVVKNNGNKVLETLANSNQGHLSFFEGGVRRGRISAGGQSTPTLYVEAVDEAFSYKKLYLKGSEVEVYAGTILLDPVVEVLVQGNAHVAGTFTSSDKQCYETTSQGIIGLYTRESPDVRYIDEGRAQLVNGQCIIDLLTIEPPLFPECVESESDLTMWHVHLTPIGKFTPCVIEIYDSYIAIASIEPGVNGPFTWSLSATRKGKSGVRFPRMEWLVGGDEENDPVLSSNWEDEILSGV